MSKDIGEIMEEIKRLINDAGSQGYKLNQITPKDWIDTSRFGERGSCETNGVHFDIDSL